jgi:hypothetical protein
MGWLICGACLRIRLFPIHGPVRLLGFCPGDRERSPADDMWDDF